jgi:hypothetical protein
MSRHPSTMPSPNVALPTAGASRSWGTYRGSLTNSPYGPGTLYGISVDTLIDVEHGFRKLGLEFETAHELLDRCEFMSRQGGALMSTDDGPRLDDESEALFKIGREVRS